MQRPVARIPTNPQHARTHTHNAQNWHRDAREKTSRFIRTIDCFYANARIDLPIPIRSGSVVSPHPCRSTPFSPPPPSLFPHALVESRKRPHCFRSTQSGLTFVSFRVRCAAMMCCRYRYHYYRFAPANAKKSQITDPLLPPPIVPTPPALGLRH